MGNIRKACHETAIEVLGKERKKNKPWVTDDILDLYGKRRDLKKTREVDSEAAKQHNEVKMKIKNKMKENMENRIQIQCENIEPQMREITRKVSFNQLKKLTKSQQSKSIIKEDIEDSVLPKETVVIRRWTEYCQDLYNCKLVPEMSTGDNTTTTY